MSRFASHFDRIFKDDFEQEDLSKWKVSDSDMSYVEWSADGIHWTQVERVERYFNTSWSSSSVRIDEGAGVSTFHLRFRVGGSTSKEYFYVDNVVLAASDE